MPEPISKIAFVHVADEQQLAIEHKELGSPLPPHFKQKGIPRFPTPGKTIGRIKDPNRRAMLDRLYPEYEHLCTFTHGLAESSLLRGILRVAPTAQSVFSESKVKDLFDKEIRSKAAFVSLLSMVQAATELLTLYPHNVDLKVALSAE